jgi:hypothetical protein
VRRPVDLKWNDPKENTTILINKTGHPYEIVRKITLKYLLQKERFW